MRAITVPLLIALCILMLAIACNGIKLERVLPEEAELSVSASTKMEIVLRVTADDGTPLKDQNVTFGFDPKVFVKPMPFDKDNRRVAVSNETGHVTGIVYFGYKPTEKDTPVKFSAAVVGGNTVEWGVEIKPVVYVWAWIQIALMLVGSIVTICGCILLAIYVMTRDSGTEAMNKVSIPIRDGAQAFMRTQYITIAVLSIPVAIVLFVMYAVRDTGPADPKFSKFITAAIVMLSFLFGCTLSGLAGFIGMLVAVRANGRVASAATTSYRKAFTIAVTSGAFAGFVVVTLSLIGVLCIFAILFALPSTMISIEQISPLIVGFAFGASFSALFAQLGGGIYTKAADVGADLVGKVESNIPEDDVRNPAVIADLVGDCVGDCAGRGADIFESMSAENISCMIIAGTLAATAAPQISSPASYILFPLMIHVVGMLSGWAGIVFSRVKEFKTSQVASGLEDGSKRYLLLHGDEEESAQDNGAINKSTGATGDDEISGNHYGTDAIGSSSDDVQSADTLEDPTLALGRGFIASILVALVLNTVVTYWLLYLPEYPYAWIAYAVCGFIGVATALLFVVITVYYTEINFWPVKRIVRSSMTGAATNIIEGISVGLESTVAPVVVICIALLSAYYVGKFFSGIVDIDGNPIGGLFGTAVATVGMLSLSSFILMMDIFGPIADNAGGVVEMSNQPEAVRLITDKLDACGNTTKATTKGFAVGSAALASFLLFSAFLETIASYSGKTFDVVNLATVEVFIGALTGACLVFIFSSLAIRAVGKAAQSIIHEVRRQFRERPGIMTYDESPDYAACVSIVTRSALIQMILPGSIVVIVPVTMGFLFRLIGWAVNDPFLGAKVTAGLLIVATIAGILMGLFLNNAGGAWDNSKKAVELYPDQFGGKGSETHKASVVGDTVGDPFKDTAGPSIHVLIKLLASLALVVGPLYINAV